MVALYRPGPMQCIDDFMKRKHGEREITYMYPKMEKVFFFTQKTAYELQV